MKLKKIIEVIPNLNLNKENEDIEIEKIFCDLEEFEKEVKEEKVNLDNILYIVRDKKFVFKNSIKKTIIKPKEEIFEEIKEILKQKIKNIIIPKAIYDDENFEKLFKEIIEFNGTNIIYVEDILKAEWGISSIFFSYPSTDLKVVGIYGDIKGRLIAHFIKSIYEESSIPVYYIDERKKQIKGAYDFQKLLYSCVKNGYKAVIVNTSAVSLKYDMYAGTSFEASIFGDISEEKEFHEDNFDNLNEYLNAALKLYMYSEYNIINNDDYASDFVKGIKDNFYTYGVVNKSTYNATDVNIRALDTNYLIIVNKKVERISLAMYGMDAVYASLAAITYALNSGLNLDFAKDALKTYAMPYQREMLQNDLELQILLDETTDAKKIDEILKEAKKLVTGRTVVLVSRDGLDIYDELPIKIDNSKNLSKEELRKKIKEELKIKQEKIKEENKEEIKKEQEKRKELGRVLSKHADIGIITTGNSKFENQNQIIKEIESGVNKKKTKIFKYLKREDGIISALYNIQKRDLVAIFGIGEKSVNIKGKEELIDQKEIINKYLEENKEDILLR